MTDTSPALDEVGAALAARLQARTASRGVSTAPQDPSSRAWARSRDDSGAPGASPRRARLLSRVMEGFGTALPAWDRLGRGRGATVLRVLGEAYVLSPDGFVWVVPQADEENDAAAPVSPWATPSPRRTRPSASLGRPSTTRRPTAVAGAEPEMPGAEPRPAVEGAAQSEPLRGPESASSRPRRRGRAIARAAARALPSSTGSGARARPLPTSRLASSAWSEAEAPSPSIAAAFARLDAPETLRRALPVAADPVWLASEGEDPGSLEVVRPATWGVPTPARGATTVRSVRGASLTSGRSAGGQTGSEVMGATPRDAVQDVARAEVAAARPLARAARRAELGTASGPADAGRSIVPRPVGARGELAGLAAPRVRGSQVADLSWTWLDASGANAAAPAPRAVAANGPDARRGGEFGGVGAGSRTAAGATTRAATGAVLRASTTVASSSAPGGGGYALDETSDGSVTPGMRSPSARALARVDAAESLRARDVASPPLSPALAAPPMSWIRPESDPTGASSAARPSDHAARRALAGPAGVAFVTTGGVAPAGGPTPDAFADAVRARHEALAPVRSASRRRDAPEPVWLDAASASTDLGGGAALPSADRAEGARASLDLRRAGRSGRARPTARLRERGAAPEARTPSSTRRDLDAPGMTLAAQPTGAQGVDAGASVADSGASVAEDTAALAASARRGGHVGIAAWRRALSAAPRDVASALASSPELGAKVVAAMRQMKALPPDEAKPLHARTQAPAGVAAPVQQQEARREKTAAALATLRGSPMRTRADRPNQTRLTRLASKLEGLVHLVESEQREAEAQRWVRRASEPAEAAGPTPSTSSSAAPDVSLDALQREVLEAVLRELERASERGERIGHAHADW